MSRAGAENLQYAMFLRVLQSSFPIFSMLSPHLLSQCFSIAFIAFLQLFIACLYCFYGCRCSLLFCHFNNNNKLEGKKIRKVPSFLHYIQSLRLELVNGACFSLSHFWFCSVFFCMWILTFKYLLSRDNLNASAVLITSTYACSSNRLDVTFKLWFSIANLNADCTSSVPCSNIAPVEKRDKDKRNQHWSNEIG